MHDQDETLRFLGEARTHGLAESPKRIDTHAAIVFLAGRDAYKVKRAVKLPFLDYSTLERRRAACEAEIRVNRRNAPELYLGTVPIVRGPGGLAIGGDGEPVEWAVHLRRFDETRTLDHVAERGELSHEILRSLAAAVVSAHAGARVRKDIAATRAFGEVIEGSCAELDEAGDVFDRAEVARFAAGLRSSFAGLEPLLRRREAEGFVRACHGDLHLRNIVLIENEPVLFDAIEFDEAISVIDILYDLAFLIMDLWVRGLRGAANELLNRYLWRAPDLEISLAGLAAVPLFLALRAAVRAKVEAIRFSETGATEAREAARTYLAAGNSFLAPAPAQLLGVGGLSGTGKTTLAALLAAALGRPPGAVHLRSDIERKRLLGADELARLPESAYARDVTDRVYDALRRQAGIALRAGQAVIVDAVHGDRPEREALADVAERAGVPFLGVWLRAPADTRVSRVAARSRDASDATPDVALRQADDVEAAGAWDVMDASGPVSALADDVLDRAGRAAARSHPAER